MKQMNRLALSCVQVLVVATVLAGCGIRVIEGASTYMVPIGGTVVDAESGVPVTAYEIAVKPGVPTGRSLWETGEATSGKGSFFPDVPRFKSVSDTEGAFNLTDGSVLEDGFTVFVRLPDGRVHTEVMKGVKWDSDLNNLRIAVGPASDG
jgi:hypothetical protein